MVRLKASAALVVAAVVGVTACGSDREDVDLSGVEVTVGSRDFTEQLVLGEILVQALDAAGATVTDATDTGDLPTTRAALEDGSIDAYWEYNSAVWVDVLGNPPDAELDGDETTELVRDADEANGIQWLGRSTFNNTYGFALTPRLADEHQTTRYTVEPFDLDDLAGLITDDDLTVCVEAEFLARRDGYELFVDHTGDAVPDDQLVVLDDIDAVYAGLADGDCDVGEIFTTDGRLTSLGLEPVHDPGVFLVYNVSLNVRDELYDQAPDEFDALVDEILSALTDARVRELNARVAAGEPVGAVAGEFLDRFDF